MTERETAIEWWATLRFLWPRMRRPRTALGLGVVPLPEWTLARLPSFGGDGVVDSRGTWWLYRPGQASVPLT